MLLRVSLRVLQDLIGESYFQQSAGFCELAGAGCWRSLTLYSIFCLQVADIIEIVINIVKAYPYFCWTPTGPALAAHIFRKGLWVSGS